MVLYVYTIQQRDSPEDEYRTYFETAARCQLQISSIAEGESLAHRYSVVLEELRLEALKQTQQQLSQTRSPLTNVAVLPVSFAPQATTQQIGHPNSNDQRGFPSSNDIFQTSEGNSMDGPGGTTPSSLMADLTSWGEFDHLVCSDRTCQNICLLMCLPTGDCWHRGSRLYVYGWNSI